MEKMWTGGDLKLILKRLFEADGFTNGRVRKICGIITYLYSKRPLMDNKYLEEYCSKLRGTKALFGADGSLERLDFFGAEAYCNLYVNKQGLVFTSEYNGVPDLVLIKF